MPTNFGTTALHTLRYLLGNNPGDLIDDGFKALAEDLDGIIVTRSSGTLAARPVSTTGSPGILGRVYYATDTGDVFFDYGTGWVWLIRSGNSVSYVNAAAGDLSISSALTTFAPVGAPLKLTHKSSGLHPVEVKLSGSTFISAGSGTAWLRLRNNVTGMNFDGEWHGTEDNIVSLSRIHLPPAGEHEYWVEAHSDGVRNMNIGRSAGRPLAFIIRELTDV